MILLYILPFHNFTISSHTTYLYPYPKCSMMYFRMFTQCYVLEVLVVMRVYFINFNCCIVLNCMIYTTVQYLFLQWWAFGIFPVFATTNHVAKNTHVFWCLWQLGAGWGRSLGNEIAGLNGCIALTFPDSDKLVLKVVVPIYAFHVWESRFNGQLALGIIRLFWFMPI